MHEPDGISTAVGSWSKGGDGVEDGSSRDMFGGRGLKEDDMTLDVACQHQTVR